MAPKQNIRQGDGAGAGMGFRGGAGKPGYPLPDELKPEPDVDSVLEDVIGQLVSAKPTGLVDEKQPAGVVKRSPTLDLVIRNILDGILGEADAPTPKDLPKGISHLEDLKPDQFLRFLEKYKDLPLKGGLEVSEKVDGSARISFGVDNGRVWTQSKNGQRKTDASQYGDQPMFRALKAGHQALASKEKEIAKAWPKDVAFMVAEVLFTKIPNSIEYGPNVIMIHGVQKNDGSTVPEAEGKKIADAVTKAAHGQLHDGKDPWKFEYKRIIKPDDVMIDVKEEFSSIAEIYKELKALEPNKLKAVGKGPYKAALEKFKAIQLALKKKLVGQLRKQQSVYGPPGGDVEGVVFRDLESGEMTKLVDKDYFTKLNKFLWHYRELLDKGVKVGDKWEFGVMQKFRNAIADNVMGSPVAKTPSFVPQLKKFGADLKYPEKANTPEKKVDYLLSQYVKQNDLMKGDFVSGFEKELAGVRKEFEKIRKDWDSKKKQELTHDVKDDEGNVIKHVKMDQLIKDRTDDAFKGMEEFLTGVSSALESIKGMKGDLTKKTALMKLLLGQGRLEKLQSAGEEEQEEGIDRLAEAEGYEKISDDRSLIQQSKEKLAARGTHIPDGQLKMLGSGTKARAYDIGNGKVIKVTSDVSDAQASLKLKGKNLKHVVKVFDVFRFPDSMMGKTYGIVTEKLEPIPGTGATPAAASGEAEQLDKAIFRSFMMQALDANTSSWAAVLKLMHTLMRKEVSEVGSEDGVIIQRRFIEALQTLKKFQIPEMVDELGKTGVGFHDYHAGNIMKRPSGDYAVVDLGYSDVRGGHEPEVLEQRISEASHPDEVLKHYKDKLLRKGIDISKLKKLGEGYNGIAYDMGNGKVLKITEDETEARASNHLKGKKLKHVVKIFDVFAMPTPGGVNVDGWYGIVQEKLSPLSEHDKQQLATHIRFVMNNFADMQKFSAVGNMWDTPWKEIRARVEKNAGDEGTDSLDALEELGLPACLEELQKNGISYGDVHSENFMRRGSDLVVIDLGGNSKSPGQDPKKLEKKMVEGVLEALREAKADQVGVTIGRFQPFHKGHAEVIRSLARKFNKVLVIVAGNSKDKKNPFSFDTRVDMIQKSLPDVNSKVEIHKAQFGGKGSGYIPGVLSDIVKDKRSALEADTAVHILVGPDRFEEMKKQMEHAKGAKEQGTELMFDPNLAVVEMLPGVKNDDDADRISGTKVREALAAGNKEAVKSMMDPHLTSNPAEFEEIYEKLRQELAAGTPAPKKATKPKVNPVGEMVENMIFELLSDIGGEQGVENIMQANKEKLANSKWRINVDQARALGHGQEGVAFDIGNGKVLKVTADPKEAITSYGLKGKTNLKHVVRIFDVFRFADTPGVNQPVYGVVTEKLTPLSAAEVKEFDDMSEECQSQMGKQKYLDNIWSGDWDKFLQEMKAAFVSDISKESQLPAGHPRLERVLNQRMQRYTEFFKKYKVPEMMKELHGAGIKFADYHGGNLMKRGSEYVINDLGRSETPSKAQPPALESAIMDVIGELMTEIGPFTGMGDAHLGRYGTSAVSSFKNRVDPEKDDLWQNQLSRLQIYGQSDLPEDSEVVPKKKKDPRREPVKGRTKIADDQWFPFTEASKDVPFITAEKGVGNGEHKVMKELEALNIEATPVKGKGGFAATSDILIIKGGGSWDGNWEVKEIGGSAVDIRPGTAGKGAGNQLVTNLENVVGGMLEALSGMDQETRDLLDPMVQGVQRYAGPKPKSKKAAAALPPPAKVTIEELIETLEDMKHKIKHGEFAATAFRGGSKDYPIGLLQIAQVFSQFVKANPPGTPSGNVPRVKTPEQLNKFVDLITQAASQDGEKVSKEELKQLGANTTNVLLSALSRHNVSKFVTDSSTLEHEWMTAARPSLTFKDVKGVIVVNEKDGYAFIPTTDVDEYLEFLKITQGAPKYVLKKPLK